MVMDIYIFIQINNHKHFNNRTFTKKKIALGMDGWILFGIIMYKHGTRDIIKKKT